jgi:uncharacterized OB-fold protein
MFGFIMEGPQSCIYVKSPIDLQIGLAVNPTWKQEQTTKMVVTYIKTPKVLAFT